MTFTHSNKRRLLEVDGESLREIHSVESDERPFEGTRTSRKCFGIGDRNRRGDVPHDSMLRIDARRRNAEAEEETRSILERLVWCVGRFDRDPRDVLAEEHHREFGIDSLRVFSVVPDALLERRIHRVCPIDQQHIVEIARRSFSPLNSPTSSSLLRSSRRQCSNWSTDIDWVAVRFLWASRSIVSSRRSIVHSRTSVCWSKWMFAWLSLAGEKNSVPDDSVASEWILPTELSSRLRRLYDEHRPAVCRSLWSIETVANGRNTPR